MTSIQKRKNSMFVVGLVLLDVVVKLIINLSSMGKKIINNKYLGFYPKLNTEQLSVFNNEWGMDISLSLLILLNLFVLIVFVLIEKWMKQKFQEEKFIEYTVNCLYAGIICSLIDKIFWGGSLDYIVIFERIVDLKDIYLVLSLYFYFIAAIKETMNGKKNKDQKA